MTAADANIGALELGILFSTLLYGVVTLLVYLYLKSDFKDTLGLRVTIGFVWALETTQMALTWGILYVTTVTKTEDPFMTGERSERGVWPLAVVIPTTALVGTTVQCFYAHRLRVLSGGLVTPIIVWIVSFARCALAIAITVVFTQRQPLTNFAIRYAWLLSAIFAMDAFVDVLNTTSICYFLRQQRSHMKSTQKMVDKLVVYAVESGLATCICALAILICSLVMPHNLIFVGLYMIYPRLISICLLSSLNARKSLRRTCFETAQVWTTGVFAVPPEVDPGSIELSAEPEGPTFHKLPARITTTFEGINTEEGSPPLAGASSVS